MFNQLEAVTNTVSREYCVISAYNTGPRNVFRAFSNSKDATAAINQINGLQPGAVYDHLKQHLPYEETRNYLQKVTASRKAFVNASDTVGP
jgi:membrane-bound lytic murein transglycosylase C